MEVGEEDSTKPLGDMEGSTSEDSTNPVNGKNVTPNSTPTKVHNPNTSNNLKTPTKALKKENSGPKPAKGNYYSFVMLSNHVITKKSGKVFRCDICAATYRHVFSLKRHFLRNHITLKYISQSDIANCKINISQASGETTSSSVQDGTSSSASVPQVDNAKKKRKLQDRDSSTKSKMTDLYRCHMCSNAKFSSRLELKSHYENHPNTLKTRFPCEKCDAVFTHKQTLFRHITTHQGSTNFPCVTCGKSFENKTSYMKHAVTHTDSRTCKYCSKVLSTKANKMRHERIHEGLKPYPCKHCHSQFTQSGDLKKHLKRQHNALYLTCAICSSLFSTRVSLRKHMADRHNHLPPSSVAKESPKMATETLVRSSPSRFSHLRKAAAAAAAAATTSPVQILEEQRMYSCTVCKKSCKTYISMLRHRRQNHPFLHVTRRLHRRQTCPSTQQKSLRNGISPQETERDFYKSVSNMIADNLLNHVDGKTAQLSLRQYNFSDQMDQCSSLPPQPWSSYNFPTNFDVEQALNVKGHEIKTRSNEYTLPNTESPFSFEWKYNRDFESFASYDLYGSSSSDMSDSDESVFANKKYSDIAGRLTKNIEERKKLIGKEVQSVFLCSVCKEKFLSHVAFDIHSINNHPNVLCTCVEIEGNKDTPPAVPEDLRFQFLNPTGVCFSCIVPPPVSEKPNINCTKCSAVFSTAPELHEHIIHCGNNASATSRFVHKIVHERKIKRTMKMRMNTALKPSFSHFNSSNQDAKPRDYMKQPSTMHFQMKRSLGRPRLNLCIACPHCKLTFRTKSLLNAHVNRCYRRVVMKNQSTFKKPALHIKFPLRKETLKKAQAIEQTEQNSEVPKPQNCIVLKRTSAAQGKNGEFCYEVSLPHLDKQNAELGQNTSPTKHANENLRASVALATTPEKSLGKKETTCLKLKLSTDLRETPTASVDPKKKVSDSKETTPSLKLKLKHLRIVASDSDNTNEMSPKKAKYQIEGTPSTSSDKSGKSLKRSDSLASVQRKEKKRKLHDQLQKKSSAKNKDSGTHPNTPGTSALDATPLPVHSCDKTSNNNELNSALFSQKATTETKSVVKINKTASREKTESPRDRLSPSLEVLVNSIKEKLTSDELSPSQPTFSWMEDEPVVTQPKENHYSFQAASVHKNASTTASMDAPESALGPNKHLDEKTTLVADAVELRGDKTKNPTMVASPVSAEIHKSPLGDNVTNSETTPLLEQDCVPISPSAAAAIDSLSKQAENRQFLANEELTEESFKPKSIDIDLDPLPNSGDYANVASTSSKSNQILPAAIKEELPAAIKEELPDTKAETPKEKHECPYCSLKFSYLTNYRRHLIACQISKSKKNVEPVTPPPSFMLYLPKKDEIESSMLNLVRHQTRQSQMRKEAKVDEQEDSKRFQSYTCDQCHRIFLSLFKLLQHRVVHKLQTSDDSNQESCVEKVDGDTSPISETDRTDDPENVLASKPNDLESAENVSGVPAEDLERTQHVSEATGDIALETRAATVNETNQLDAAICETGHAPAESAQRVSEISACETENDGLSESDEIPDAKSLMTDEPLSLTDETMPCSNEEKKPAITKKSSAEIAFERLLNETNDISVDQEKVPSTADAANEQENVVVLPEIDDVPAEQDLTAEVPCKEEVVPLQEPVEDVLLDLVYGEPGSIPDDVSSLSDADRTLIIDEQYDRSQNIEEQQPVDESTAVMSSMPETNDSSGCVSAEEHLHASGAAPKVEEELSEDPGETTDASLTEIDCLLAEINGAVSDTSSLDSDDLDIKDTAKNPTPSSVKVDESHIETLDQVETSASLFESVPSNLDSSFMSVESSTTSTSSALPDRTCHLCNRTFSSVNYTKLHLEKIHGIRHTPKKRGRKKKLKGKNKILLKGKAKAATNKKVPKVKRRNAFKRQCKIISPTKVGPKKKLVTLKKGKKKGKN